MPDYFTTGYTAREAAWHELSYVPDRNPSSLDELLEWTFCYDHTGRIKDAEPWEPEYTGLLTTKTGYGRCDSRQDECREPAIYTVTVGSRDLGGACEAHAEAARRSASAKGIAHKLTITPIPTVVNEGWQAIKRSDNGHLLHVSKTSFEVFGNREAAELLMRVLEYDFDNNEELGLNFETGMVLKDGGMVVFCVSMDTDLQVPGDPSPIRPYSSVHNYHDGSGALKFQNTSIREVCWNTASTAEMEGERTGRAYSFRHSKNIRDNIEEAIQALKGARDETEKWVQYATELVAIPVDDMQFEDFLQEFVPEPPKASKRVMNNVYDARGSIRNLYTSARTTEGIRGTAWGVVSAAGEYLDHKRTFRTPQTYVSRTMLKPEYGKHQAMELIADIVDYDNDKILAKVAG